MDNYRELLKHEVEKDYKKAGEGLVKEIRQEHKDLVTQLEIADRVEITSKATSYITIKDHKESFPNKISTRLIIPCKSELRKVSKQLLDDINKALRYKLKLGQVRNTAQVITWFRQRDPNVRWSFTTFDIESFYPSISENLINNALEWAASETILTRVDKQIILSSCKNLLYTEKGAWVKSQGWTHDVTMGSYPGAEIAELVGLYLLHQMKLERIEPILCRDDGYCSANLSQSAEEFVNVAGMY